MVKDLKLPRVSKKASRSLYYIAVLVAIILSVSISLIFCWKKQGYHVDEVYSYGLANSYYKPFLDSHDRESSRPEYLSSDYYNNYISTNEASSFKYDSVIYNQEHDVHPPLFYLILHTICSFFPGDFNKWFGLSINIVCLIITLIIIFLTARLLTANKFLQIACIVLYGCSTGAILTTTYIRMYAMLTMFVSVYAYIHAKMAINKRQKASDLIALAAVTFLGFFTQYYFIIFAAFMSILYMTLLALSRRWKDLRMYIVIMLIPLVTMLVVYPAAYTTILGKNEDVDGFNHAQYAMEGDRPIANAIVEFAYFLNSQLFSCLLAPIASIAIIALILKTVLNLYHINPSNDGVIIKRSPEFPPKQVSVSRQSLVTIMLIITSLLYFITVTKITYLKVDRYLFCIYPIATITFIIGINCVLRYILGKHTITQHIILALTITVILILQYTTYLPTGTYPDTLYSSDKTINDYMSKNANTVCIYIYNSGNEWSDTILTPWLRQCYGGIYKIDANNVADYVSNNNISPSSTYTLFIDNGVSNHSHQQDADEIVNLISDKTGKESKQSITTINGDNHWSIPTSIEVIKLE